METLYTGFITIKVQCEGFSSIKQPTEMNLKCYTLVLLSRVFWRTGYMLEKLSYNAI